MVDPKLMSNDQLIQCLTVKATALRSDTFDLIDSAHDDLISREFYDLKIKALSRMGEPSNAHNIALLDELAEVATKVVELPDKEISDRYFQIKEEVLLIMAENSSCDATIATALQS